MRALTIPTDSSEHYIHTEVDKPIAGEGELLIRVAYAGINRADLFQLQGKYPLPSRTIKIPGLEVSGEVVACGSDVTQFVIGDVVCALMSEGAFAQYVCVPATHALPVPRGMSLEHAAALPEACFTAWVSLVWQAKLQPSEVALIHGGASGVGTLAIQIAKHLGAKVFATTSTAKVRPCAGLGAHMIDYVSEDFTSVIKSATGGTGADVILDMIGGDYFARNLDCLAQGGRLCLIAFLEGSRQQVNLSPILLKHLSVMGSTLRARTPAEKAKIAGELQQSLWPALENGSIKPMIHKVFPLHDAEKALSLMQQRLNVGKILLKM